VNPAVADKRAQQTTAPRYQPLVIVLAAVSAGIFIDRRMPAPAEIWWLAAATSLPVWLALWRHGCERLAAVALAVCLASLGGAWHHLRFSLFAQDELGLYSREEPHPVCVEAVALGGVERLPAPPDDPLCAIPRGDRSRLTVKLTALRQGEEWQPASGRARLLVDGHLLGVHAGDRLRVFGQLSAPAAAHNPGEFDFAIHARGDRELSLLSADFPDCIAVTKRASGFNPWRQLAALRQRGRLWLWRQMADGQAGLASALLLGVREDLDADVNAAFTKTGTVHLLSISGLHVGILAAFLFALMRLGLAPRKAALAMIALATIGYALLIDAEPPAVRAAVIVLFVCASQYLHRRLQPFNALAAAALVVLAWNPEDLFRAGPQLSFLAVAALAWFGPWLRRRETLDPLERLIAETRPWPERAANWLVRAVWQSTALSFCVWAVSAPLVLSQFHLFSPATLVLTPLLALPVAVGLTSGFLALAIGWLAPPLGWLCGRVCERSLAIVDAGVEFASHCRGSHFWAPGPEAWWLWGFYGLLSAWAVAPRWRPPPRWCAALLAGWMAVGFSAATMRSRHDGRLDCTFLSVGHGCAVVIELPDVKKLLYDAGRLGSPAGGARSVAAFLWSRGITHLDAIVISHADVDHYNAVPELLEKFSVGVIYVSPLMLADEGAAMQKLLAAIDRSRIPLREIVAGDRLRAGGDCHIEVLHPTMQRPAASDNANSVVLSVEYQGRRILLTGDLESPGMNDVIAESPLDCDVILAPHHGSARSDPPGFSAWSTPEWVIISGGHGDERPEVSLAYSRNHARVLHAAKCGAIRIQVTDGQLAVESWRVDAGAVPHRTTAAPSKRVKSGAPGSREITSRTVD
jgi:competence protein ComEC